MIFTSMTHSTKKFNILYFLIILSVLYVRDEIYCHSLLKSNSSETTVKYSMLQYDLIELIPSHVITNQNITKVNYDSCFDHTIYNSEYMGYYEQKDIVLQQYLSLPYPAVPKELLEIERNYYHNTTHKTAKTIKAYGEMRIKPFRGNPGMTAESINHYLYQGKNNFR